LNTETLELNPKQRAVLRAVCDTIVPSVEVPDDPSGFFARKASDLGVDVGVEQLIASFPEDIAVGLFFLLEVLAQQGFVEASLEERVRLLAELAALSDDAAAGNKAYRSLTLLLNYGLTDASGKNPNWAIWSYPGPLGPPPSEAKVIRTLQPAAHDRQVDADVCVVGSGAGGGVIAARLSEAGMRVVVLEAGGYFNEADFDQLELTAYRNLFYRGGLAASTEGASLLAGSCLGGGTTVNWTNCVRTPAHIREEWAALGLVGVNGSEFDAHLDAVLSRISANDACSDLNDPNSRLQEGCQKLGWSFRKIVRNADRGSYDPQSAGYLGFGDQSGSKQGTLKTYLLDAYEHGAQFAVRCRANRILSEDGHTTGVEALFNDGSRLTVRTPRVVVACGALESPALLMRSGIGGPAVGQHLKIHPVGGLLGLYPEPQVGWWGAPQTGLCDQFVAAEDGHGVLLECVQYAPALAAASVPWVGGRQHKEEMLRLRNSATLIAIIRDHGSGSVEIDERGEAVHHYALMDELDQRNFRRGLEAIARVLEASGAEAIHSLSSTPLTWSRGEDLNDFVTRLKECPVDPRYQPVFSAHQTGSCRMGLSPESSVCDPHGQLHDVEGVWIGDGSAFPNASGINPMVTIMALARRTADAIQAEG
jgi:choline dehydrogenase-like flavoprotein